jgi:hypothetical protein
MDKRGEGVVIILERSTTLSGRAPIRRLVDERDSSSKPPIRQPTR